MFSIIVQKTYCKFVKTVFVLYLSLLSQPPDGKENLMENGWESQLDTSVLQLSRQKILQVLNSGSLKELKGLQQIGDKKAKLILGWREINGHFTKVGREDVFSAFDRHRFYFLMVTLCLICYFAVGWSKKSWGYDRKEIFLLYDGKPSPLKYLCIFVTMKFGTDTHFFQRMNCNMFSDPWLFI